VKFSEVAHYFDQIEPERSRIKITELLSELLERANPQEAAIICDLSLGQLDPPYIGTQFNLAEKNILKVIEEVTGWNEQKIKTLKREHGDLGAVIALGNWRHSSRLTVDQVYDELKAIEQLWGEGSQEKKNKELVSLLLKLEPLSAKYVVRIILVKIRLGFSDMTVIDALSWMEAGNKSLRSVLEHAYNICVDIGLIARTLKEKGIGAIKDMKMQVGIPVRPAAAERLTTAPAIMKKIGICAAQPKFDGFRLQIHIKRVGNGKQVLFFSRNLLDMSYMFPDLKQAFANLDVSSLICEGEAIVHDPDSGNFLPFQETIKRKRKHGISTAVQEFPLQLFIFDVLYLDGNSLLDETHEYRRGILVDLFNDFDSDIIKPVQEKIMRNAQAIDTYFAKTVSVGLEGLVIKRLDAPYTPGKRNFNWIKLKRQSVGELSDTIDPIVLGYYHGSGKRAAFGIGAFLIGIYNKKEDRFESIAKVGTGLSDEQWVELRKKCDKISVKQRPKDVVVHKDIYPDVWVEPEIVVEIIADEITLSPTHAAGKTEMELGFALRFPRFLGYRPDKDAMQTTTLDEIKRLYENQFK
jgi:DNA ligase 1